MPLRFYGGGHLRAGRFALLLRELLHAGKYRQPVRRDDAAHAIGMRLGVVECERAAEAVPDEHRLREMPLVEQRGEIVLERGEARRSGGRPAREARERHRVHAVLRGEVRDHAVPRPRAASESGNEHDRIAAAVAVDVQHADVEALRARRIGRQRRGLRRERRDAQDMQRRARRRVG